jgi:hypothetical protein
MADTLCAALAPDNPAAAPCASGVTPVTHGDASSRVPGVIEALAAGGAPYYPRTPETIAPLLGRWRLTEDGIQPASIWRDPAPDPAAPFLSYGAAALKD